MQDSRKDLYIFSMPVYLYVTKALLKQIENYAANFYARVLRYANHIFNHLDKLKIMYEIKRD